MKLHGSAINEIVRIVQTYAGHRDEFKVREALQSLDLSTYLQSSTGNQILVLTEELRSKTV
jgi:hypothetical protein